MTLNSSCRRTCWTTGLSWGEGEVEQTCSLYLVKLRDLGLAMEARCIKGDTEKHLCYFTMDGWDTFRCSREKEELELIGHYRCDALTEEDVLLKDGQLRSLKYGKQNWHTSEKQERKPLQRQRAEKSILDDWKVELPSFS